MAYAKRDRRIDAVLTNVVMMRASGAGDQVPPTELVAVVVVVVVVEG